VKRFVYLTIHHLEQAPAIPHFASKLPIEAAVKASGMEWTLIRPNNFFQNEEWFRPVILGHGVYPQPLGPHGLSRVDVRDIAEAAAIAVTQPGHNGRVYELVGPDILTGEGTADAWSRALGRPVRYAGDDLDQWENTFRPWLPALLLYDFRLMYRWFIDHGLAATPGEVRTLTDLLGHPPRSFEAYVKETAARWLAEEKENPAGA
ncbi:MAG TPA: NmrA family NAD(P)-binding protein, partial [Opitutaceae bacterium]